MDTIIKKEKDVEILAKLDYEIQNDHNQYYPNIFKPYDYEETFNLYKSLLDRDTLHSFIGYVSNKPIGFTLVSEQSCKNHPLLFDHSEIFIDSIVVLKEYQSRGIGRLFMQEIKKLAKDLKYDKITLNVWEKNINAVNFYKKLGFKELFVNMEMEI